MTLKTEYSIDGMDAILYKYGGNIYDSIEQAQRVAKKTGGVIFTQVDSGGDYPGVFYSKGVHFVNRTGMYAVVGTRKTVAKSRTINKDGTIEYRGNRYMIIKYRSKAPSGVSAIALTHKEFSKASKMATKIFGKKNF